MAAAFCGQIVMADRRKFIATLSNGEQSSGGTDVVPKGDRRAFLASLSDGAPSAARIERSIVNFDLGGILEFKGAGSISSSYKQPPAPPRLRPNYDSSKRKLYANPEVRQKYLRHKSKHFSFDVFWSFRGKLFMIYDFLQFA